MTQRPDIAQAIDEAARSLNDRRADLDETLQTIAEVAHDSIPGMDHVGISTVERDGRITTRAHTDAMVGKLDSLQYDLGEGPCVSTLRSEDIVLAPHLRHDQRWPRYVPAATQLGLQAQLAVRLFLTHEGTVGGLNLYSTSREDLDPDAEPMARLFATQAAIALGHAKERSGLNEALHTRKIIGQAIGIVMERYGLDEERAFAFLLRASSTSNVKLRDVAQQLVQKVNDTAQ